MNTSENKSDKPSIKYEIRTVAFIDILGFSDLVARSLKDVSFLGKLHNALKIVEYQGRVWVAQAFKNPNNTSENNKPEIDAMDFRSHSFSDCIVLSQRGTFVVPLFLSVSQLMMALMDLGVLVRGGISIGPLYHDTNIVFGPALIEAYKLESRGAKSPRILVSGKVYIASQDGIVYFPDQGNSAVYRPCEFLKRDSDRQYHLDCLTTALISPQAVIGSDNVELLSRFKSISSVVRDGLIKSKDSIETQAKWGWFMEYFNEFVRIRTSHIPDISLEPINVEDDTMDPAYTWEKLRNNYYRNLKLDLDD